MKVEKRNFMQELSSITMLSSDADIKDRYRILITPKFTQFYCGDKDKKTFKEAVYKYNGEVKSRIENWDVIRDITYNGIPLKDSHFLSDQYNSALNAQIEHVGKYLILYTMYDPFREMPYVTGYIIYDAKTLEPIEEVIPANSVYRTRYVEAHRTSDDYTTYPVFILYDRWSKAFYTYINGARSQKHLSTTIITDDKLEKHTEAVDRIFVERWNPISGKIYGVAFKGNNKVEISGVLQGKFVKTNAQLTMNANFDDIIVRDLHLSVLPDGKADVLMNYYNILSVKDPTFENVTFFASTDKKNDPDTKRALLAEFKDMQLYVETDIDMGSPWVTISPPRFLLYKKGKLIKKIPSKLSYTSVDSKGNKTIRNLQPLGAQPIASVNHIVYTSLRYYGSTVIQGEKHFAFIEWWRETSDGDLKTNVRIFDYDGNLVSTLNTKKDTAVPISQDANSHYVIYFKQTANNHSVSDENRISVKMYILDVDTMKHISVPVSNRCELWNRITYVPRKIPRLYNKMMYSGNIDFKFCCNKLVIYNDTDMYMAKKETDMSRIYAVINIDTKKAFILDSHDKNKKSPEVYIQDPYMVLNDKFNAIVDEKEEEVER